MFQSFGTAESLSISFAGQVALGSVVVILMATVAMSYLWSSQRKTHAVPVAALALLGIVFIAWIAYSGTYARFIAVEANASELRLRFAGPMAKDVVVPAAAVDKVLFGSPGKSSRQCYIRFLLKSGDSYRSRTLDTQLEACRILRQEFIRALAPIKGAS